LSNREAVRFYVLLVFIEKGKKLMTFEELLQLTESNAKAIAANSDNIAELRAAQDSTGQNLDRLTNLTERYINASTTVIQRLDEGIAE
jgi:uncharacterized protein YdeI (YjbR/CyaY-like superfamily)